MSHYSEDDPMRDEGFCHQKETPDPNRMLKALMRWMPPEKPFQNELEAAGYCRNMNRHAQAAGPLLILTLVERGFLGRDEDPTDVLRSILDTIEELEGTPDKSSEC